MNKVIYHLYDIYIASPLLKKRFGYKLFAINLYFGSSQYYRTLDKTLVIKLSLFKNAKYKSLINEMGINVARIQSNCKAY
jgi:hypothetical protein